MMQEFDFSKACEEGVVLGLKRLDESSYFPTMISSFCETYGNSLSSHTGETIVVRESLDPLELLRSCSRSGRSLTRFPFLREQTLEGPERDEISASLMSADGKEIKKVKVFDCVKDRLTGFPCSIEYNGKSVLCNTRQELLEALNQIPAERSAYIIKGLGLDGKNARA